MYKITFPEGKLFTGNYLSVAFKSGVGETDSDYLAERFERKGLTVTPLEMHESDEKPLEKMTVDELKEVATKNNIDISGAKTKAKILGIILANAPGEELKEE